MRSRAVTIRNLRAESGNGSHRVTAEAAGHEVWFESRDWTLQPSIEAMGSALLIPALLAGVQLRMDQEACPVWLKGAHKAAELVSRWWDLPIQSIAVTPRPVPLVTGGNETALCFTGGVDSFYSLLRSGHRPALLVFVHGYDIAPVDEIRLRAFVPSLERVAADCGARAVLISTNLRQHPLVASAPWTLTHGGALAAIGHLLSGHAARLVVASSVPKNYDTSWGSHWQLDPLWSSGAMNILHDGADFAREQKAWAVAAEPLLTRHLRVCWENRAPTGNCSACDKCVNTMLLLQQAGQLERYDVFEVPPSFVPLLEALPQTTFVRVYRAMCQRGLPGELEAAVQRLLIRTARANARTAFRKRVRRVLDRMLFRRGRRV